MGTYMLAVSISIPLAYFLLMDAPSKILTGMSNTKNLFQILGPAFCFSFVLITLLILNHLSQFVNISSFIILIPVFFHKLSETIVELEIAYLKKHQYFKLIFWVILRRQFFIYLVSILMLFYGFNLVFIFITMALISCILSYFSILNLKKFGWSFKPVYFGSYFRRELSLAFAIGLKFLSSNVLRYFVVYIYGLSIFGYMAPAFYALTAFSNVSTVLENVLTPRFLKIIQDKQQILSNVKLDLFLVSFASVIIFISAYLFAEDVYSLFYPEQKDKYASIIIIFSSGFFFYVMRAILKSVSIKIGLEKIQIYVQCFSILLLILLLLLFNTAYGVYAPALAFVLTSFGICALYLLLIVRHKLKIDP